MDFAYTPRVEELRSKLISFMDEFVFPAESIYRQQMAESGDPNFFPPIIDDLKKEARSRGLWNLFLPDREGADGFRVRALGRDHRPEPELAPEALNCSAPDTGNMEILSHVRHPRAEGASGWRRCSKARSGRVSR